MKLCGLNYIIPGEHWPQLSPFTMQERLAANGGALDADALRGVSAQFQALAGPIADFSFNLNVGAHRPSPTSRGHTSSCVPKCSADSTDTVPLCNAHVPSVSR